MKLGLYCNWGVTKYNGQIYVPSIHNSYIEVFKENSKQLYLLSKTKEGKPSSDDVKIEGVEIIELPYFNSYISAIKYFFHILLGIKKLVKKSDFIYIRVPEPFSWLAAIIKLFYKTRLHYHYVSVPLDVIDSYKAPKIVKIIKKIIYLPEYYLSALASYFNNVSCLGTNGKNKIPFVLKYKVMPLYEASYRKNFKSTKNESKLSNVEKVRFLYVGRLVTGKGLEELVESVRLLCIKNNYSFSFTIAGDGILKKKLEKLVLQYDLQDKITFIGAIKFGNELDNIYATHDVLVSPSFSETGPRTVLEAASNFLYVISTDVGYVREIFCRQAECYCTLIQVGSIKDLVNSFEYVLSNKNKCKLIADKSQKISKLYTLDSFVENIISKVNNEE